MAKGDRRKVRLAGVTFQRGNEGSREKSGGAPEPHTEASRTSLSTGPSTPAPCSSQQPHR